MFKIIDPQYHCFYKTEIDQFLQLLKEQDFPKLSDPDIHMTTFILAEDEEQRAYGGALLLEQKFCDLPSELMRNLSRFVSYKKDVWRCTTAFHIEEKGPLYRATGEVLENFCQAFYRQLYDHLVEFGRRKGIGFLCITLNSTEYFCTEGVGHWPFIFELKPKDSLDHLFHSILPLTGSQYESYKKAQAALDISFQERKIEG